MEWQRNKSETVREQVELHALPPKRDLAAEEADAASEDARSKSKGRNRRRCRQQQQLGERPQLVTIEAPPPLPFPGSGSRPSDVTPFWRSSKSIQEEGRSPFPARVNVWLQRPGVDLFPKQPVADSELQKADELASATEEKMIKLAVEASLKTAEEEGTILLPQPPRSTKSTYVQPPSLENEDWEADMADNAESEKNPVEQFTENQQKMESSDKKDKSVLETQTETENVSSPSKESPDHKALPVTVNYTGRLPKNDNHATSWYQSSTKERTVRSKGDGKARNSIYMEEKASEKIVQWKKPTQENEMTVTQGKNLEDRFRTESVNNKKTNRIPYESQDALKAERWRSDWKDRRNNFNEKLSHQNSITGRKPEEVNRKYISDVNSPTQTQAPKEQRTESKHRNRHGSVQCSEDDSQQHSEKDNGVVVVGSDTNAGEGMNVNSVPFVNNIPTLTLNKTKDNSRNVEEENSVCDRSEGDLLNSCQNNYKKSFTNVCSKSENKIDFSVSSATYVQTDPGAQVRTAVWHSGTENSSHQYEEKLQREPSSSNDPPQQQSQILKQDEAAVTQKRFDNRGCTSARVPISPPPGLQCHEQHRNEQVPRGPDAATKQTSKSERPEQESSVDEFFRKYAQHNSTTGQAGRLPEGNLPMGAFRVGGSAPGLSMQPNCAPAPVIAGATGVPPMHPSQIRVCGVPQMYQACGMLPDMGTTLQYSTYPYVDGIGQRPLLDNRAVLQSNNDCCPSVTPQSSSRFGGNGSQRQAVVPVTPSSQSPEGAYPSYGSCNFEGGQQAFSGNHLGSILKNGGMAGYGNVAAASSLMPVEVMMPGLGGSHPTGVPPPPGVFTYPAVTPLTGVSPPRCGQLQQGLVLQPIQVPQDNIGDRQVTPRQENSAVPSVQESRGSQVHSNATQGIPRAGGVPQNTVVTSGNGRTPASQDSSHTVLNRSTKSQLPQASIGNANPPTVYSSGQPSDMNTFLTLHQNGVADSQDVPVMSQWPLCCFSQTDMTQLQGVPQIVNADGTVSHFTDMAQFGMPQSFKQPGTPIVDHIWYAGIPPLMPVHDSVNVCRNNQAKQFGNVPEMHLDAQATMVPQMRGTQGPHMSQFGPESQQLNDHSQIYFPGIGHIPAQGQLTTPSVSTPVPPGLPTQPPFPQGAVQQQMGFTQHPPGILHTGMCQNVNSPATAGNNHRNASAQPEPVAVPKGRIGSESTVSDGLNVDSKHMQKMPRVQSSQDGRYTFPGDGSRADVSYLAEKLRQSSLSQRGGGQGMQTTVPPQGTFQSITAIPGSAPKAQLYYEKVQSLLCQPPDAVSRLLQQMHLNAGVAPVTDPSAGTAVGPQGFVVPPAAEVWPVVHSAQLVQERLHPGQTQGGYTVAARGRGKGRGRLRDVDG